MNTQSDRPVLGITMGDPAGIGPEIIIKSLADPEILNSCIPVVLGDIEILKKADVDSEILPKLAITDELNCDLSNFPKGFLMCLSNLNPDVAKLGHPTVETGSAMETYINAGVDLALSGAIDALVTGPITKTGLKLAGSSFHGHTELIAHKTGTDNFAMMMAGPRLKVVLTTIHIPLSQVPERLSSQEITRIINLTRNTLITRFGIKSPRLAVAGLNPHAGEQGMFGNEEADIILPAIIEAQEKGVDIRGPYPPDTVFFQAVEGQFDAVICMYHDQGLIPFKLVHFRDGVNTTIGLPIIRTSVDHGTAYDIAWTGKADPSSMKEAIKMAAGQAINQKKHGNSNAN
ncbi:4-hydroxythreonine-4-phosphate dehydrogenase PdxA [Desulfobacter hydrogenophilus]|uniref:4-hydroxythreonine-4-phosphate dehydrogenase n=1 Tax=Desulfobacter hydrogenophilus TaxID=2291 RepID=A0A328FEA1_9BACT|nr:4-hydroxythreonine-4-phosphate dehydrogenase PdxA [Desulfobacter hydrogenophilus]NDY72134.1 4-hydroxythreonine-4-phosphate dehydrogenase PdxA [Desulfobacter hydrogenophilus]QBH14859.1 4-hydroxythreonine-4-phosphate dehydrogenase PdxA [Desulfobacter hydrogenophilus]RAM01367.1 4-hydroxythreonine-4-phosphate dehydrogenase PdxA [Desulfobacter hydrogenophilus]